MSANDRTAEKVRVDYYCAAEVVRTRRRIGQPIPGWLRRHYEQLEAEVRMSRTRQQIGCDGPSLNMMDKWIGSPEAAAVLGWSKRQVQRHAADLDGQIISGRWLFREAAVRQYAEGLRQDG